MSALMYAHSLCPFQGCCAASMHVGMYGMLVPGGPSNDVGAASFVNKPIAA